MADFKFRNVLNREADGAWCSVLEFPAQNVKIVIDVGCNESVETST